MRNDPAWNDARSNPLLVGGKRSPNHNRTQAFRELRELHGFTAYALMSYGSSLRQAWIREHVLAQEAQELALRAFQAVNGWAIGRRGRPRFKTTNRGLRSMAVKDTRGSLRLCQDIPGMQWGHGLKLPFALDSSDPLHWWAALHVAAGGLLTCRIVRSRIGGRWVFRGQLVLNGLPYLRYNVRRGHVGLDLGPSVVAVVSDHEASLERFCDQLVPNEAKIRILQRKLARQHRAGSPRCFDEKGRHLRGECHWRRRSRRAQETSEHLADAFRTRAAHRLGLHGNLANRVFGQGNTIHLEKLSYRSFQKAFGRSVAIRAPGLFVSILRRKAESAGGELLEIDPRSTALSQHCVCGRRKKKSLSERTHECDSCGIRINRDVLSAFLALHVVRVDGVHQLDTASAQQAFASRHDLGDRSVSSDFQPASERRSALSPPLQGQSRSAENLLSPAKIRKEEAAS